MSRSFLLLNLAVLLWAMTALFAKVIPLPADSLIWIRSVIGVVGMWVAVRTMKVPLSIARPLIVWVVLLGILMTSHWVTFFTAAQTTDIGLAILALYTYPVITILLEPLVSKEKYRLSDALIGLFMLLSLVVMTPEFDLNNNGFQGIIWGIVSAVLFAARNLVSRYKLQAVPGMSQMFYQVLIAAILLLPISLSRADLSGFDAIDWVQLFALAWFFVLIPHTLFVTSLKTIKAQTASLIATIQPVYGVIFAYMFLAEIPTLKTIIGGSMILSLAVIESIRHSRRQAEKS